MEDTSAYIYNRLLSLNEVGGDPRQFGVTLTAFHRANQSRARDWPHTMLTTSSHDTKRSEDVRARINVVSEIPAAWRQQLRHWSHTNRNLKHIVDGILVPTPNDEYFIYQTLLGVWPLDELDSFEIESLGLRLAEYFVKAAREAKVYTSWINPNKAYEGALLGFVNALIHAPREGAFLSAFIPFQQRIARFGMLNSLSQTLIKFTVPGVPDIYQGCELWDFSLVDPDNRRQVDFGLRRKLLDELLKLASLTSEQRRAGVRSMCDTLDDGQAKLLIVRTALALRERWPDLFQSGTYMPLTVRGKHTAHLCAYARIEGGRSVITIVPRFFSSLLEDAELSALPMGECIWDNTTLDIPFHQQDTQYICAFTGKGLIPQQKLSGWCIHVAQALADFPVGLFFGENPQPVATG
jgi:(1->4)-alpha-D-glucan 1-alpha-D-glucosylmutase